MSATAIKSFNIIGCADQSEALSTLALAHMHACVHGAWDEPGTPTVVHSCQPGCSVKCLHSGRWAESGDSPLISGGAVLGDECDGQ